MDFLLPITIDNEEYSNFQIGKYILTDKDSIQEKSIVLLGVNEFRNGKEIQSTSFQLFRDYFYGLAAGNWKLPIFDLGTLQSGNDVTDTYFALKQILEDLADRRAIPIIIGGSQDLLYSQYQVLAKQNNPINYTSIDAEIPLDPTEDAQLKEENLLNHLIKDSQQLLFHFSNIGYQSYYTSYQIIDTINGLDFEAMRLGEVVQDLKEVEPILRSTDLVSINLNALQSTTENFQLANFPNGFNGREICAIAKYVGLSSQVKSIGLFNYVESYENRLQSQLLAEIVWYMVEGLNARNQLEKQSVNYKKFIVLHQDKEIVFLQDEWVNKWWILLPKSSDNEEDILIPCTQKDYDLARQNEIPERYWKNLKKYL